MEAFHQVIHSFRKTQRAEKQEWLQWKGLSAWEPEKRPSGMFPTCEEGVVVEAPLLVLVRADIKQVGFDGPVNEVRSKVKENHTHHGDGDGPDQLPPWVSNQR